MGTEETLAWLRRTGTAAERAGLARYGIEAKDACGVPMGVLLEKSKEIGVDHALSLALWKTGCYEARLLAALIGDPAKVTKAQMLAWGNTFENWGDGDTACFKLFDRSPFAWEVVEPWARSPREPTKRAAFALLACLALHDKNSDDAKFERFLPLIEKSAADERNFVKKGVSWALRAFAMRGAQLRTTSLELADRLAASTDAAARWIGSDVLRQTKARPAKGTAKPARPSSKSAATGKPRKAGAKTTGAPRSR
jgi:3-methyladenine DNA glycosylase AlkD